MAYSASFYDEMKDSSLRSARAVVPVALEYIKPASVVDVGSGTGNWLKAFLENGAKRVQGFDGQWVDTSMLVIPKESFAHIDLEKPFDAALGAKAGTMLRTADLAVCLEVAEHLPAAAAPTLIANLVSVAPVVLFSAAIPSQGGTHHVNEQWPAYWEKLFAAHGYVPVDCLRRRLWNDPRVSFFYAQNIFFYADKAKLSAHPKLAAAAAAIAAEMGAGAGVGDAGSKAVPLVHPQMYLYYAERWRLVVPFLGKLSPKILHGAKKLLKKLRG